MSLPRIFIIALSIIFAWLMLYIPAYYNANKSYIAVDYDYYYSSESIQNIEVLKQLPDHCWQKEQKIRQVHQETYKQIWMRIKPPRGIKGHFLLQADDQAVIYAALYRENQTDIESPKALTGQGVPYEKRTFNNSWPILPLEYEEANNALYYVLIKPPIHFPFTFRLLDTASFQTAYKKSLIFNGFFLGGVLIMLAHAIFYSFKTRQKIFGWYSFYVVCVLIFYGLYSDFNQILLDLMGLNPSFTLRSLAAGILILGIHNYGVRFLHLEHFRYYRHYNFVQILIVGVTSLVDLLPPFYALTVAAITTSLFIGNFIAMFLVAGRYHKNAKIFLYAFVTLLFGGVVTIIDKLGITERTPLLSNQVYLSFLVELMLFSLYLGTQFNEEKTQKDLALDEINQLNLKQQQAKAVQKALIASEVTNENITLKTTYRPAETIGGDLVCLIEDKEQNILYLFIGDISGHGISAALMSSNVIGIIKGELASCFPPFHKISDLLLNLIKKINSLLFYSGTNHCLTLFAIAFDMNTGEAIYVNAGHVFPLLIEDSMISTLHQTGSVLGLDGDPKLTATQVSIKEGALLMLYTDGLVENEGERHERFRIRQMRSIAGAKDLDKIMDFIDERTRKLWGKQEQRDDYTVVLLRVDKLQKQRLVA